MWKILICFFLISILIKDGVHASSLEPAVSNDLRLPKTLRPAHYLVRLQPFLDGDFSIDGYVEIMFDVDVATDKIVLHIDDIITKNETVKVYKNGHPEFLCPILNQTYDQKRQFYTAHLHDTLQPTEAYVISMEFTAYLNHNMKGFFRSSYEDSDGNLVWLAATQFEPTDARKAFPCFDEPGYRSKFTIDIARREEQRALSNMPRYDEIPVDGKKGWVWDKFRTSVPMPTYLVAFVVSDFALFESEDITTIDYPYRIWTRKEAINTSDYAMDVGLNVSRFFEDFLQIPYSLPKQDTVAVPDFPATAMENWGLILYRENYLLTTSNLTSAFDRMMTGTVISHELAHMWFGNLVSPVWWTHIWLNEGFAKYFEAVGLDHFDTSMRMLDQIIINDVHPALQTDCLMSSHPVRYTDLRTPDDFNEIFDVITYSKGSSILRMVSNILTEETFKVALSNYLTNMSYSNAEQDDLFEFLTEQAHEDGTLDQSFSMKEIMDTWTLQMGYPVLNVERSADGNVTITQERFVLSKPENQTTETEDTNSYRWWVPLTYTTSSELNFINTRPKDWMRNDESKKILSGLVDETDEWYLFNIDQMGFYRVNYDESNWNAIAKQLRENHTMIGSINRAQIINDAFNLARGGQLPYRVVLDIVGYLKNEDDFFPLKTAMDNLKYLKDMMTEGEIADQFKEEVREILVPLYERIDLVDDVESDHLEQRIRAEVFGSACDFGHQNCIDYSVKLFSQWMETPEDLTIIPPNLKPAILCVAIAVGGDAEWQFAWDQYIEVDLATEKTAILSALGCSTNVTNLNKILTRSIRSDGNIRKHEFTTAIISVANNNDDSGLNLTWKFLQAEWNNIIKHTDGSFAMGELVSGVTRKFKTQEKIDQIKSFLEKNAGNLSSSQVAAAQSVERAQNNFVWVQERLPCIQKWLRKKIMKNSEVL